MIRPRPGSSSTPSRLRSSMQSRWICAGLITFAAVAGQRQLVRARAQCGTSRGIGGTSDWFRVGGGDGFYVQVDPTDHNTIYAESQNGAIQRLDLKTGRSVSIRPRAAQRPRRALGPGANPEEATAGEQVKGAGWSGRRLRRLLPLLISFLPLLPVNSTALTGAPRFTFRPTTRARFMPGPNKLFKSVDRGDTWTASPDLTKQIDRSKLPIMGSAGRQAHGLEARWRSELRQHHNHR